jgi:hypothetical protein
VSRRAAHLVALQVIIRLDYIGQLVSQIVLRSTETEKNQCVNQKLIIILWCDRFCNLATIDGNRRELTVGF